MAKRSAEAEAKKQERDTRDHDVLQQLGARIRSLRNHRDLTQEKLAEGAGLTPKFLGEVERAETNPSATSLVRIARGLNVGVGDLFVAATGAIPVSAAALKQLKEAYQALGHMLTGLTRLEPAERDDSHGPGGRSRQPRKE